jgi:hypothetical protein
MLVSRQKQPGERIINRRLPSAELLVATGISLPFYATVLLCLNLYIITFSSFHVLPHSLSSFGLLRILLVVCNRLNVKVGLSNSTVCYSSLKRIHTIALVILVQAADDTEI